MSTPPVDESRKPGPGTKAGRAGEDATGWEGATQVPVVHSVSFGYPGVDGWLDVALARKPGHIYSRSTDPTVDAFEKKVRDLEGAEAATSFSSGMAAISNSLHALLSSGDRAVSANNTCGGTSKVSLDFPPRFGIEAALRDTTDHDAIEQAVERGCEVLYLESPTNPTLKVLDLGRLADSAHSVGATVIVDNTLASPINQRPLELGADLVIHSATKFLEGTPMHWAGESAERPLSCATPIVRPVSARLRRLSVLRQRRAMSRCRALSVRRWGFPRRRSGTRWGSKTLKT